ncbi:uncharacterized protein ACNS7B_005008 [Menidia menidia]
MSVRPGAGLEPHTTSDQRSVNFSSWRVSILTLGDEPPEGTQINPTGGAQSRGRTGEEERPVSRGQQTKCSVKPSNRQLTWVCGAETRDKKTLVGIFSGMKSLANEKGPCPSLQPG